MQTRVFIQNMGGSEKWEVPCVSWSFSEEQNNDRSADFTFSTPALKVVADLFNITAEYILSAAYREIKIVNEDDDVLYYGVLDECTVSGGKSEGSTITMTSRGFLSLFSKRATANVVTYSAQDMSDIAWDLINDSQVQTEGDFGVTRGADPTTVNRDRTFRFRTVLDALQSLSNDNIKDGIDFEVDNSKVFNVYYPEKGTQRDNIRLELGHNIEGWSVRKTGIWGMCNEAIVVGEGDGDGTVYRTRSAANSYKEAYFLLQDILSEKDTGTTDNLDDKGDRYIELNRSPVKAVESVTLDYANPLFTDYEVGDTLEVIIADTVANIDGFFRIKKRTLTSDGVVYLTFYAQ